MFFLFRPSSQPFTSPAWGSSLLLNGLLCVLLGVSILAAPELLAYIVAFFLLFLGVSLLLLGWKMRRW